MPSPEEQVVGESTSRPIVDDDISVITKNANFVSDVLLAEHRALREEIVKKMDHRTSMVVCSVTVSSAVLAFGIERQSGPLLLVSPLVSLLLGILILFQNAQISDASAYIRRYIEDPISTHYRGYAGWHGNKNTLNRQIKRRLISYRLPLSLIAIAPAVAAVPLAISQAESVVLTIPILVVDALLFVVYVIQIIKP